MALIENIQREDLNPLEEAQGVQRLIHEFHLTHEDAAAAIGRSRSATSNLLRLLNLTKPVQVMLMAGDLDMGHARALLALDSAAQITAANQIVGKRLSVRDAERLVSQATGREAPPARARRGAQRPDGDIARLENELSDRLATRVEIRMRGAARGQLIVDFADLEQLDGVLERIRGTAG
jgi:ParB family chromosome partitioning protein